MSKNTGVTPLLDLLGLPGGTVVENPPANAGDERDSGLIPGSGTFPRGENGSPLQSNLALALALLRTKDIWTSHFVSILLTYKILLITNVSSQSSSRDKSDNVQENIS